MKPDTIYADWIVNKTGLESIESPEGYSAQKHNELLFFLVSKKG